MESKNFFFLNLNERDEGEVSVKNIQRTHLMAITHFHNALMSQSQRGKSFIGGVKKKKNSSEMAVNLITADGTISPSFPHSSILRCKSDSVTQMNFLPSIIKKEQKKQRKKLFALSSLHVATSKIFLALFIPSPSRVNLK